jgi:hypothetical protein
VAEQAGDHVDAASSVGGIAAEGVAQLMRGHRRRQASAA